MKITLITIDPQNDFCGDPNGDALGNKPALGVPGATEDMYRLAKLIKKHERNIDEIQCTLDSHQVVHVAHPLFWVNSHGKHPDLFQEITESDVLNGSWRTFNPKWQTIGENYVKALKRNKRYTLRIWPEHCYIGSWGHSVFPAVSKAFQEWETNTYNRVQYFVKGSNLFTEHYSAIMADVPDDSDPSTKLNTKFINPLKESDVIWITGEALSHCLANTILDTADNFGEEHIKKFVLLRDTCSNVYGCETLGEEFIKKMVKRGMRVASSTDL